MSSEISKRQKKVVFIAQLLSFVLIWVLVIGIAVWIFNLLRLSIDLDDAPGATIGISLVAIPVFFALASILTYVFVGLQKEERRFSAASSEE